MPLRRRLLALVALVLALCLVAGGALTYWHGLLKVELEMSSATDVAASAVGDAISTLDANPDAPAYLNRVVHSFDGDRHVVARLIARDGSVITESSLRSPGDPAPSWLYKLLAGPVHAKRIELPNDLEHIAAITIRADPHNEIGEVWEDLKLKFLIIAGFCSTVLALIYAILGRAHRPHKALS
jgi:two-component system sensor histidine kinase UhpB